MPVIQTCHRCPWRQRPCAGPCACLKDGRDITDHARVAYCPEKKFGDGIAPAGWATVPTIADAARRAHLEAMLDAQGYTRADMHKDGCNCGGEDRTPAE